MTKIFIPPVVISLHQPYATLFIHQQKNLETRPLPIFYRGRVLIHAAMKMTREQFTLCQDPFFKSALKKCGIKDPEKLPLGKIIGSYNHQQCLQVISNCIDESLLLPEGYMTSEDVAQLSEQERAFGDYTEGRWIWTGNDFRVLNKPFKYKGSQGYYNRFKGTKRKIKGLIEPTNKPKNKKLIFV